MASSHKFFVCQQGADVRVFGPRALAPEGWKVLSVHFSGDAALAGRRKALGPSHTRTPSYRVLRGY